MCICRFVHTRMSGTLPNPCVNEWYWTSGPPWRTVPLHPPRVSDWSPATQGHSVYGRMGSCTTEARIGRGPRRRHLEPAPRPYPRPLSTTFARDRGLSFTERKKIKIKNEAADRSHWWWIRSALCSLSHTVFITDIICKRLVLLWVRIVVICLILKHSIHYIKTIWCNYCYILFTQIVM